MASLLSCRGPRGTGVAMTELQDTKRRGVRFVPGSRSREREEALVRAGYRLRRNSVGVMPVRRPNVVVK
jgi:hypothetical protein